MSARPDTLAELRLAEGKLLGWGERSQGRPVALQPRDGEILTALARYRYLTTAQTGALWWEGCGLRAVRRRLTRLFEAGLLERFRPQTLRGAFQWTYCLTLEGFRAAEQSGELPQELRFTPRRERIFDFRYVIHDLRVNEWVITYRRLAGDALLDWAGPDESRLEPPKLAPYEYRGDGGWEISMPDREAIRPIQPDARLEVAGRKGELMLFLEYDRTRRVDKNYDKFRRYDALVSHWWHYGALGEWRRPLIVFICQDEAHRERFLAAADYELGAYRFRWREGVREVEYPGRDWIVFVLEEQIRAGDATGLRLPALPPGSDGRPESAPARSVRLPGVNRAE